MKTIQVTLQASDDGLWVVTPRMKNGKEYMINITDASRASKEILRCMVSEEE